MTKLQNAYEVISDPVQRRAYNLRWPGIRDSERARRESEQRQADAAQAEKKRAAAAKAKRQEEDTARRERLGNLESAKRRYDDDIFELARAIRKLVADLKRLEELDAEDVKKERERNGWWAYLAAPIYGRAEETEEQKGERETARLNRVAGRRVKGSELAEKEKRMQRLREALENVSGRIEGEKRKAEDERRRGEEEARARRAKMEQEARERKVKMEQEARDRAMREMRERMARAQKEQAEREAEEAREAKKAQEARERAWGAWEREREAAAAERRRQEAEERARAVRRAAEEAARKARKGREERSGGAMKGTCRHKKFWTQIEGRQMCGECRAMQNRFAFQCPGCKMVACANCRQSLRGEKKKKKNGGGSGRQYGFAGNDDNDFDIPFYDYD